MADKRVMVDVDHVTIRFNLASQKIDNLKEYFIKFIKGELMFQEFLAVQDISFQVREGEAWGLIGSNGSGKSTMLKAISGIIKPYKGTITVNGNVAPLIELGAGFDLECTARENIYLNGCVLGHPLKFMEEHFDEIVEFAEIHKFLDSPIKNYSSGMKARLGFSIATMVKPDILIVDEILSVGDYKFRQKCEKRMKELLDGGTTLLFVSHNIDEVRRLCDHAIWIDHGQMRMVGEVNAICDAYMEEHFDEIVEFAEIGQFLDSPIKNYSSGMKARLGFAVATMVKPDILIVDEVLAVGDYKFRQKCEKRMKELLAGGTTLLYVSHNIDEVKRLCDHAVWLDHGDLRMIGSSEEVCNAYMEEMKK